MKKHSRIHSFFVFAIIFLMLPASLAFALSIELPLNCMYGENCWIQHYAEHDKSSGALDYQCTHGTYDAHDGTDFRILDPKRAIEVVAVAPGTVLRIRDGISDELVTDLSSLPTDKYCGNGVVIQHKDGYETQYCHLKKNSLSVRAGEVVVTGQKIGLVGYSGAASFAHVHLTVRKNGAVIDPFSGLLSEACSKSDVQLWSTKTQRVFENKKEHLLFGGFTNSEFGNREFETGEIHSQRPHSTSKAIVGYAVFINTEKGDRITLTLRTPYAPPYTKVFVTAKKRAIFYPFVGVKNRKQTWPKGKYTINAVYQKNDGTREEFVKNIDL